VIDFVVGSFVIALTPVALGVAWKLVSGVGYVIGRGLSGAFETAEQWGSLHRRNLNRRLGPIALAGRTPCPGNGPSWASNRRGLS
jgi:hypothetical protein